jgi:hypothetical protein
VDVCGSWIFLKFSKSLLKRGFRGSVSISNWGWMAHGWPTDRRFQQSTADFNRKRWDKME